MYIIQIMSHEVFVDDVSFLVSLQGDHRDQTIGPCFQRTDGRFLVPHSRVGLLPDWGPIGCKFVAQHRPAFHSGIASVDGARGACS